MRAAAAALGVAPATAHRWWHRWQSATETERVSRACLRARPPRPRSCPWALSMAEQQRILDARARTNYGPARLAGLVGYRRSTVHKVLARHGVSRRRCGQPRQSFRRYEWSQPGALLHMDTKRLQRFSSPGHWAHGDRSKVGRAGGEGYVYAHCVVDDHSRLAYVELHPADNAQAVTATLKRAIRWMTEQGAGPLEALMTDNAMVYRRNRSLADLLAHHDARHIHTPPYTPRWNGKARALHPNARHRMGTRSRLAQQHTPRPGPAKLPALLQPPPTTHLTRRPAPHQPRSPRPWAGQLGDAVQPRRAAIRAA